eukprot:6457821-Amphidinium_carterae.8
MPCNVHIYQHISNTSRHQVRPTVPRATLRLQELDLVNFDQGSTSHATKLTSDAPAGETVQPTPLTTSTTSTSR